MKKLNALFFVLLVFTFHSCKKNKEEAKSEFIINGVANVSIDRGSGVLGLEIQHMSGTQKVVNLAVHGLPEGIEYNFSSWSGTPTFATALTFSTAGNHEGNSFPVTLHATNGSVEKEYTFTVYSEPAEDCVSSIVNDIKGNGRITLYSNGQLGQHQEDCTITGTVAPGYRNRITIDVTKTDAPSSIYLSMYMDVNCFMNTLIIPQQTMPSGATITGSGRIEYWKLDINYTITDQDGNSNDENLIVGLDW